MWALASNAPSVAFGDSSTAQRGRWIAPQARDGGGVDMPPTLPESK
jgi:hypothetical protein